jgi:hypothetical protein
MVKIPLPLAQRAQIAVPTSGEMGWNSLRALRGRAGQAGASGGSERTYAATKSGRTQVALKTERTRDPQDCWPFQLALAQTDPAGASFA